MFEKPQKSRERERERERGIVLIGLISLLLLCPNDSFPATVVGVAVELCPSGQYVGGECVEAQQNNCPSNYNDSQLSTSPLNNFNTAGCGSGYAIFDVPSNLYVMTLGTISGDGVELCSSGQYVDGECVETQQNNCPSGYNDSLLSSKPLYNFNTAGCGSGYKVFGESSGIYIQTLGTIAGTAVETCASGIYSDGTCSALNQNDCPSNYNEALLNSATISTLSNGSCDSGYKVYNKEQLCDSSATNDKCVIPEYCSYGATQLKTKKPDGTIYSFPLFTKKHTKPSINIRVVDGGVCYVDLEQGNQSGTLNVKYNNTVYHATK